MKRILAWTIVSVMSVSVAGSLVFSIVTRLGLGIFLYLCFLVVITLAFLWALREIAEN